MSWVVVVKDHDGNVLDVKSFETERGAQTQRDDWDFMEKMQSFDSGITFEVQPQGDWLSRGEVMKGEAE